MKLKLMTYNIAAGRVYYDYKKTSRAPVKLDECVEVIKKVCPDVCGINEIDVLTERSGGVDQPTYISQTLQYNGVFGKTVSLPPVPVGEYGNALFSRFTILDKEIIKIPDSEQGYCEARIVLKVKLDVGGHEVYFMQTHLGLQGIERETGIGVITDLIDNLGDKPTVLMGDFNTTPDDKVFAPLKERLFDTGSLKEGFYHTYPAYQSSKQVKIDYIFTSRHFKPLTLEIPQICVSDHLPYVIETEFTP